MFFMIMFNLALNDFHSVETLITFYIPLYNQIMNYSDVVLKVV
jgi:hypothetical protein